MKREQVITAQLVLIILQVSCAAPGKAVSSAADILPDSWTTPDSILCVQISKTVGQSLKDAALTAAQGGDLSIFIPDDAGPKKEFVFVEGFGSGNMWNDKCGIVKFDKSKGLMGISKIEPDPCVCGKRDIIFVSAAALAVDKKGLTQYSVFRHDPVKKKNKQDIHFMIYTKRKGEKQGECADVELTLMRKAKKYVEVKKVCFDKPAEEQFFELSSPATETGVEEADEAK